jgi:tetrahydrodipicolinate N-succinyltransferase
MLYAERFGMIENPEERFYNQYDGETIIGNDVWIGCNAVIMRGVHIGDGAVIGANAVITKDVAPYLIMGGVNHVIKKRFDDNIIDKLQEIEWWNYPIDVIKQNIDLIAQQPTLKSLKILHERLKG